MQLTMRYKYTEYHERTPIPELIAYPILNKKHTLEEELLESSNNKY